MSILGAVIVPHPPVILPEVGRGREHKVQATLDAYRAAARQAADWAPETLIITSPHAPLYSDYFHISPGKSGCWDMSAFGAPQVRLEAKYDEAFRMELVKRAQEAGLQAGILGEKAYDPDHGTAVPLYFLREAGVTCPIVRIGLSGFTPLEHYQLGQCIAAAAEALGRRTVLIASGDLSHKLTEDGPYGFVPEGPAFDEQITAAMAEGDFARLLSFDPIFCGRAAECGLRSFQIMAGALDGLAVRPQLLSHEGTFGVGYAVAVFTPTGPDESRRFGLRYERLARERLEARKAAEDPWVRLARQSLETYIRTGQRLSELPEDLPEEMCTSQAGAFVSLHIDGQLRGCIGTISPAAPSVAEEIVQNAVSAGTGDPRFRPVRAHELDRLEYKVDVLGAAEQINSPEELDVRRYGVIVSCGHRRGLLLPDLEGVDTVEQQIDIARQKGGIAPDESYTLERFEVVRHI
ncbi:MAG: AmmeMemoRadiSam system protein A [Oscillospiraceae bacterium]|nr:AmmeMemoRadiSam system protein A [Oscillospiraceae bacterium]